MPTLLLLPFAGDFSGGAAAVCTAVSNAVLQLAVFLIVCDIARGTGASALLLFGIEEATAMFRPLGAVIGAQDGVLQAAGVPMGIVVAVGVAGAAVATLALFDGERLAADWGVRLLGPGRMAGDAEVDERVRAACERAVDEYGLTAREAEVLALLARGFTIQEMCDELCVARGTVKAHCEHIYQKIGVRGKREVVRALGIEG